MENEARDSVNDFMLLNGTEIKELLEGKEKEIMDLVKKVYCIHSEGKSMLPQSTFLRFPEKEKDRIIALPAFVGGDIEAAGLKWISSFPENINHGIERASAVLVLNTLDNGRIKAIMESSVISAKRTAAGAAAAADCLLENRSASNVGMVGCGYINYETFRFLTVVRNDIRNVFVYDIDVARAKEFIHKCREINDQVSYIITNGLDELLHNSYLVSFATTSSVPYVDSLASCKESCVILHTSLRDLSVDCIRSAENIVDDVDHVLRAQTSVHLTEQKLGNRDFIRCSIGEIYNMNEMPREKNGRVIYSPFGLGVLDVALGEYVYSLAMQHDRGMAIKSFYPDNWLK